MIRAPVACCSSLCASVGILLAPLAPKLTFTPKRHFWQWLNAVFNKYDEARIREVGPDRAAAEWLIRCGASVRWAGAEQFHSDYNTLPVSRALKIQEIDATDSSIMHIGFPYLRGLTSLRSLNLRRCHYVRDEALQMLACRKDSLEELRVISCGNVSDHGVKTLSELTKLKTLELFDLPEVKDKDGCVQHLRQFLPACKVEYRTDEQLHNTQ
ncbi:unnamed protein product [Ixodes pacificus]